MISSSTTYEIRWFIRTYLWAMCSDSLGAIQAALKKLLAAQMVTVHEVTEKGIVKKRYSVTGSGFEHLLQWLQEPALISSSKTIEQGKVHFLGFLPAEGRRAVLTGIVDRLTDELTALEHARAIIPEDFGVSQLVGDWDKDSHALQYMLAREPDQPGSDQSGSAQPSPAGREILEESASSQDAPGSQDAPSGQAPRSSQQIAWDIRSFQVLSLEAHIAVTRARLAFYTAHATGSITMPSHFVDVT